MSNGGRPSHKFARSISAVPHRQETRSFGMPGSFRASSLASVASDARPAAMCAMGVAYMSVMNASSMPLSASASGT